ncbi:hypothetical protein ABZW96_22045 [Nocardia sp. NPDC004168]|uniref:hypothetical protein n=1 Tax=Nocardia sp. NPDC004168 TaxID=3154452 RepID=UPI0033A76013
MGIETVVDVPVICDDADVELAHRIMQEHHACRIDLCAWKRTAFHTLVVRGRIVPQTLSPRERAAERNIPFPPIGGAPASVDAVVAPPTLRQVLDMLNRSVLSPGQEVAPPLEGV